jgi:hypothetical protein
MEIFIREMNIEDAPNIVYFGGTAWESNPPDLARRSQAVLKLREGIMFDYI